MPPKSILRLDVGGQLFKTNIKTLCKYPDSMLCAMFSHTDSGMTPMPKTEKGHFFLDADPIYFRAILNWLRLGKVTLELKRHLKGTMALAEYFGLDKLTEELKVIDKKNKLSSPTTVARSYETVDETIEENVRHLERELLNYISSLESIESRNYFTESTLNQNKKMLEYLTVAIKLSGGYAINKLAAKKLVDEYSSRPKAQGHFVIAYYFDTIKECYK